MSDPTIDNLHDIWKMLGPWEQRVLVYIAERILDGQWEYGKFNPETEQRNMDLESGQESADGFVYDAWGAVREYYKRWQGKVEE